MLTSETVRIRKRTAHCKCTATVGPHLVAEAQIKFMLVDDETL
jgi:3-hydroxymyristoyl/3-hydroxydecanoyl-(acyl carrier protein) dehydratase